ncbi:MAG TPA: hypothetical protein VHM90_18015 [Phycisphaerae bacterium]|nr:hypothetical protein [Phycisphaerae bacterium]
MRKKSTIQSIVCVGILASACLGAGTNPQKIQVDELGSKYTIIGPLGDALGDYHTIEGVRIKDDAKADELLLRVDTLDGKTLSAPLTIPVREMDRPEVGTRCVIRGYEWGAMEGFPTDPENPILRATKSPSFYAWFQVTKVISGGPKAR